MDFQEVEWNNPIVACDTETTGLNMFNGDTPFAFSMTTDKGTYYYRFGVDPMTREVNYTSHSKQYMYLKEFYADPTTTKVFHNASFDIKMLKVIGIEVRGLVVDTLVMAHVLDNSRLSYGLKPLCKKLLGFDDDDEKELQKSTIEGRRKGKKAGWKLSLEVKADYWTADFAVCKKYACYDTDRTLELFHYLINQMVEEDGVQAIYEMEMELLMVTIRMECKGIRVDKTRGKELDTYYNDLILKHNETKDKMGFKDLNTRSPKQMQEAFYDRLGMKPIYKMRKTKEGKKKTLTCDTKAMEKWANEGNGLAKAIISINSAEHELGSFVDPIMKLATPGKNGFEFVIHPNYRTVGTQTGRLSCTNPNLQNISNTGVKSGDVHNRARELFIPRDDCVLYFPDYSQIEVYISAFVSKDPVMMSALIDGLDMHDSFAFQFFGQMPDYEQKKGMYRKKTKMGTFATIYGAGADQLAITLEITKLEAMNFLREFYIRYQGLGKYSRDLQSVARKLGYIEDPFGRKYHFHSPEFAYKALNTMIQGSAAGIMKRAMINVDRLLLNWPGARLLLTIHDEMCLEIPKKFHSKQVMFQIVQAMQGNFHEIFGMPKPLKVSMDWTGTRWSDKKEIVI